MSTTHNDSTEQPTDGPRFGPVEAEFTAPENVLSEVRDAYERAVEDGYEQSFTVFFVTHTRAEDVTIESA